MCILYMCTYIISLKKNIVVFLKQISSNFRKIQIIASCTLDPSSEPAGAVAAARGLVTV